MISFSLKKQKKEEPTKVELSAGLIRELLGTLDNRDIVKWGEMTENDEEMYIQRVAAVYKELIEPTIKRLVELQKDHIAKEVMDQDQLMFARGTVNGLMVVMEEFEEKFLIWQAKKNEIIEQGKMRDIHALFPELHG